MSIVHFEGMAADWDRYRNAGHWFELAKCALQNWWTTTEASFTPLMVDHRQDCLLPRAAMSNWRITDAGLMVRFSLDTSKPKGAGAALAIRHGHMKLSIGCHDDLQASVESTAVGDVCRIWRAKISELSLTNNPANPRTYVHAVGETRAYQKTLPTDPTERTLLRGFLAGVGYPLTPVPATKTTTTLTAASASPGVFRVPYSATVGMKPFGKVAYEQYPFVAVQKATAAQVARGKALIAAFDVECEREAKEQAARDRESANRAKRTVATR